MFNLSLQNPLDQAKPVENPSLPAAPSTISLDQNSQTPTVTPENPQDFTTPIVNESASTPPIFTPPPSLDTPAPEQSLEEIAATLTSQAATQATAPTPIVPTPSPPLQNSVDPLAQNSPTQNQNTSSSTAAAQVVQEPNTTQVQQPEPSPVQLKTVEESSNPIQKLAMLMAEREIISEKQIDDVVSLLTIQDLEHVMNGVGESESPNAVTIVHNEQELVVPLSEILKQLLGSSEKIIVNT